MIYVNNGMPKSGSTVLMFYMTEIIKKKASRNGYNKLLETIKAGALHGVSGFLKKLDAESLAIIEEIQRKHGPLAVKTHSDTNEFLQSALQQGRISMVCSYRDPRDVILSAIDHCRRTQTSERPAFQDCVDVKAAIPFAKWAAAMTCRWLDNNLILPVSYEDLVSEPAKAIKTVAEHAGIDCPESTCLEIILTEQKARKYGKDQFNTGKTSRYKSEMSHSEIALCNRELEGFISRLGYSPE